MPDRGIGKHLLIPIAAGHYGRMSLRITRGRKGYAQRGAVVRQVNDLVEGARVQEVVMNPSRCLVRALPVYSSHHGLHTRWVSGQKICTNGLVWLALKNACKSKAMTLSGHVEAMSQTQSMIIAQASALRSNLLPGEMTGLGGL